MTKIIAPLYQHDIISKNLLQDKDILLDTTLLPLNSFVDSLVTVETSSYDQKFREIIHNLKGSLLILNDYLSNELFISSLKDFHISMHLYDINVEDLNNTSSKDQDLKTIFKSLQSLTPPEITKLDAVKEYLKVNALSDTYISNYKLTSDYEKELVKVLKNNGLKEYQDKNYTTVSKHAYYANNIRSEVEASAQLILDKNLNNPQVIILDNTYEDVIRQVYKRYNIVNSLVLNNNNDTYSLKMLSVFKLLYIQDKESVTQFLSSNPFELEYNKEITILNDFFNFDLEHLLAYIPTPLNDPIIHEKSLAYYNDLVESTSESFIELINILNSFDISDNLSLIESVFNYFLEHHYSNELISLQNKLQKHKDILKESTNLMESLESLLLSSKNSLINSDYVVVTPLDKHQYFNKENVIILGATIKNYPNIQELSGVIDEVYVRDLNYPSKTLRFKEQLEELDEIKVGENIYIFYPLSNYDGKSIEPSFSLLNFVEDKPKRYPLIENDYYKKKEYILDPSLAQQLFFEDGHLTSSLSALEQYNSCPYAYYLRYGLKLYPKSLPELSYAYIGSVTHLIIEKIVQKSIDNHSKLTHLEAIEIIKDCFKTLELLNNPQVDVVKLTLIKHFIKVLDHMDDIDSNTLFKPILLEEKFYYNVNNKMSVYGIIDRVDQYNDYVRVVDYKSSRHTLSESKLKQGLQLQLLTYLIAISSQLNLKPAGAFYMSLKLENTGTDAASIKLSNPYFIETTEDDITSSFLAENRVEGWHFKEGDLFYKSSDYVSGLSMKDDIIKTRRVYNFETVSTVVDKIYTNIYDDLSKGIIDCVPVDNPCQFCEYQSICLTVNSNNVKEPIFKDQKLHEELNRDVD